ncbi:MAG TPA: hypothetical protein VL361_15720 [Candidatus Limnocylindrales bacterium]|nr:hypothetical protein [Candidatus Limnocylindrales bacterium]
MIDAVTNFIESKDRPRTRPPEARITPTARLRPEAEKHEQRIGFTKVFRWPVPADQTPQPTTVEVAGSFNGWRNAPLNYDPPTRTWQIALNNIEGNRTHRYVILVDGKPSYDKTCDGLTTPQTPDEAKCQIATPKGPRIMLLFAQAK